MANIIAITSGFSLCAIPVAVPACQSLRGTAELCILCWESTVHRTTFTPKYKLNSYQIKMNELRW